MDIIEIKIFVLILNYVKIHIRGHEEGNNKIFVKNNNYYLTVILCIYVLN